MKNYFEYTVKHFQEFGPHQYLLTMRFPSMEKEVRDLSRWTEVTSTMMILIGNRRGMGERQYFLQTAGIIPT